MTDVFSKKKRSEIMRSVKSKDSKIETEFRKVLWRAGLRYRKNPRKYFGKPDAVLKRHRTVVFVDSCFFHGCARHCRLPTSNRAFWARKVERNKARDRAVSNHYKKAGWRVLRVWEHQINDKTKVEKKLLTMLK